MYPANIAIIASQIEEIGRKIFANDLNWFTKHDIAACNTGTHWLLHKRGELNHWNVLCNSAIFTQIGTLVSLPVLKLYNINSAPYIDLGECDLIEKVPGFVVSTFTEMGRRHYHSMYGITSDNKIPPGHALHDAAKSIEKIINFRSLKYNSNYTLTFVIGVDGKLYFIGNRCLSDYGEYSEKELDYMSYHIGSCRPSWTRCTDAKEVFEKIQSNPQKKFIIRSRKTGERFNISTFDCNATWSYFVCAWIDGEYMKLAAMHPNYKDRFYKIEELVREKIKYLKLTCCLWYQQSLSYNQVRERLQTSNEPKWAWKIIAKLYMIHPERWEETIRDHFRSMKPNSLMKILEIK